MSIPFDDSGQNNTLTEGQIFEGRFEILSVLGRGGVGIVYKARQMHMDRIVAIKTLLAAVVSNEEESFRRFQQEARTASSLDHVNIIGIYDFGKTAAGLVYLVMEYLGDQTLEALLAADEKLDLDRFLRLAVHTCDGLQHAHKSGIIHRDIKPSNIMLVNSRDGEEIFKVVDFGLAKLTEIESAQNLTKTGTIVGTPLFMSPEQCRGLSLDHRSDIYSLACVFYTALTGKVPIHGATALDTLYQHANLMPQAFSIVSPGLRIAPALEEVIFKALEKDPERRQQSMHEFRNDIQDAIFGRGVQKNAHPLQSSSHRAAPGTSASLQDVGELAQTVDLRSGAQSNLSMQPAVKPVAKPVAKSVTKIQKPEIDEKASTKPRLPLSAIIGISVLTLALALAGTCLFFAMPKPKIAAPAPLVSLAPSAVPLAKRQSVLPPAKAVSTVSPSSPTGPTRLTSPNRPTNPKTAIPPKSPGLLLTAQSTERARMVKQIADAEASAQSEMVQKDWRSAETTLVGCLALQEKLYGIKDYKIFPTLALLINCQLMQRQGPKTGVYLLRALDIFKGQQSRVLESVMPMKGATRIWRSLARASLVDGKRADNAVLLKWSPIFYELARKSWTASKDGPEYKQLSLDYCEALELCGLGEKAAKIRGEQHLPALVQNLPQSKKTAQAQFPNQKFKEQDENNREKLDALYDSRPLAKVGPRPAPRAVVRSKPQLRRVGKMVIRDFR